MTDRDSEDDERDDLDDEEEEESPPPPKAKAAARKAGASSAKDGGSAGSKSSLPAAAPATMPSSRAVAIGVAALILGGIAGWFGHIQKAKAALRAEATAPAGSGAPAGPCGAWQSKVCAGTGDQSAACQEAKGAADLLLPSTCEAALGAVPETLAKVKAGRASCDKLVGQLCKDLPPGSQTCDMVKQRTPSFPRERCDQMLQSYDKVIAELKQMDAQGGMQMGGPRGGGMPPGGMPHGAGGPPGGPPGGGMPRITIPQQSTPSP